MVSAVLLALPQPASASEDRMRKDELTVAGGAATGSGSTFLEAKYSSAAEGAGRTAVAVLPLPPAMPPPPPRAVLGWEYCD